MTIELANRLIEFRKKFNYSQEELASLLSVSRQSISKRESGEVSPSMEYLKEMAKLYKVSIDDLLNTDKPVEDCYKDTKEKKKGVYFGETVHIGPDGIHIKDNGDEVHIDSSGVHVKDHTMGEGFESNESDAENEDEKKYEYKYEYENIYPNKTKIHKKKMKLLISNLISASSFLCLLITYIILGFVMSNGWSIFWPILFFFNLPSSIFSAIYDKKLSHVEIVLAICGVYLLLGMYGTYSGSFNGWSPWWCIFFFIPVYYTFANSIDRLIALSRKDRLYSKVVVEETKEKSKK